MSSPDNLKKIKTVLKTQTVKKLNKSYDFSKERKDILKKEIHDIINNGTNKKNYFKIFKNMHIIMNMPHIFREQHIIHRHQYRHRQHNK